MRTLLALLFLLLVVSCSQKKVSLPGPYTLIDPSLAIMTRDGNAGHACPVHGHIYSARHVFWNREENKYIGATWSSRGYDGSTLVSGFSEEKDLVELWLNDTSNVVFLPRGAAVRAGEKVYWFEYDFRTKKNALRSRRRFANVLRIVAQQYILDGTPVAGASGSCLINENGEVVGIVTGGWQMFDKSVVGVASILPNEG
jgi:hypothetical protein